MFGLATRRIESLVSERHGPDAWATIQAVGRIVDEEFQTILDFEDEDPEAVIEAIAWRLEMPVPEVLLAIGRFWIAYSKETMLGKFMQFKGAAIVARLHELEGLSEWIALAAPRLEPPKFRFEEGSGDAHRLHYFSSRHGYQPLLIGLLYGLVEETGERIEVRLGDCRAKGHDHDVFEIRLLDSSDGMLDEDAVPMRGRPGPGHRRVARG
jgi:hypothetical protein